MATQPTEAFTQLLHGLALQVGNYQQFGALASKMALAYKQGAAFGLNSVEALYLQVSKGSNVMPQMLDMAEMLAKKYEKDGNLKSHLEGSQNQSTPQFFVVLVFKILLAKFTKSKGESPDKFSKALEYLEENKSSFGMELDFSRLLVNGHLHFRHVMESNGKEVDSGWFKKVLRELFTVISKNYSDVKTQYLSIFDLHELTIALAIEYLQTSKVDLQGIEGEL
jgi:hypothetical protein